MTRIIAGSARGRRLKVPASHTRPTSDRVRESLFSSLAAVVDLAGARVLDLYAGSGALGLEALSRGARSAVLVDSAAGAAKTMTENIAGVGLPGARVEKAAVADYLRRPAEPYDVVFMDPPYDLPDARVGEVLAALVRGWLAEDAVVVVERGDDGADLRFPAGFADVWKRRFGGTHVLRSVWYGHDQDR